MTDLLPQHVTSFNKVAQTGRRRMHIMRRTFMTSIILLGLFTIAWASTIHPRRKPIEGYKIAHIGKQTWQFADDASFEEAKNRTWPSLKHLVIVPGHAIHTCQSLDQLLHNSDGCWYLLPYQRNQIHLFLEHIKTGVELAAKDADAMLVFSGGQTRGAVGPLSEAFAYFAAANFMGSDQLPSVKQRIILEEYARDSFENLAFSICRFRQITNVFPKRITVVGFRFKAPRFKNLHWTAIKERLPKDARDSIEFHYIEREKDEFSTDNVVDDAYSPFENDPLGQKTPLRDKRDLRDPFKRPHPYSADCFTWL